MSHVAFDLGLTTTGFAWDGGSDHYTCPHAHRKSPMTAERIQARYQWWQQTFRWLLLPQTGAEVVVESAFWHPKHPSGSMALAMLHGLLRGVCIDGGHPVHYVTPTQLKQWATGSGAATKEQMVRTARQLGWEGDNNDEADAFLLFTMHSGHRERAA